MRYKNTSLRIIRHFLCTNFTCFLKLHIMYCQKDEICIFVLWECLSYESKNMYIYVVMFQHPPDPLFGLLCLRPTWHSFILTFMYYLLLHKWQNAVSFLRDNNIFSGLLLFLTFFTVSSINRKFTSMNAGSWRTNRWKRFYSSVPRSTYSSSTGVQKSQVNACV